MLDNKKLKLSSIILAAGYGKRLEPLTSYLPKCLMPIKGIPLLKIWLNILNDLGSTLNIVNTHHLAAIVNNYFIKNPVENLILSNEVELLGSAQTLLRHLPSMPTDDVIVLHGDNYIDFSLSELVEAHINRPQYCVMTMLTFNSVNPSLCGTVITNNEGVLIEFNEKKLSPITNQANSAIYIINKKEFLKEVETSILLKDISIDIINKLLGRIYIHHTKNIVIDIGTPLNYLFANCTDLFDSNN